LSFKLSLVLSSFFNFY